MELKRGDRATDLADKARLQFITSALRRPAPWQLNLLISLFNSKPTREALRRVVNDDRSAWTGIANNDRAAFLAKFKELEKVLPQSEFTQASRLHGCLVYEDDRYEAQRYFENSLRAAREMRNSNAEFMTLITYSNILYPSYFALFWHEQRPFPHAERLSDLANSTGFLPMIAHGNLARNVDYALKLETFGPAFVSDYTDVQFEDVFWDASTSRRWAIDMGDVAGEMEATYVVAQLTLTSVLNGGDAPRFGSWIEWQRLDLLASALGRREAFGARLSALPLVPGPYHGISRDELMTSMFS